MHMNNVFDLSDHEKVLYFSLNWFDLSKETQEQILAKARQEMGIDNIFSFPNIEIRLVVREEKLK